MADAGSRGTSRNGKDNQPRFVSIILKPEMSLQIDWNQVVERLPELDGVGLSRRANSSSRPLFALLLRLMATEGLNPNIKEAGSGITSLHRTGPRDA